MKKILSLSLLAVSLILGACGTKSNGPSIKAGRTGPNSPNGGQNYVGQTVPTQGYWVNVTNYTQNDVVNYVSTGVPQSQVGNTIGCMTLDGQPCQVLLNVSTDPGDMVFNPLALQMNGQGNYNVTGSGVFTIAVFDSYTGNGESAIAAPSLIQSGTMSYPGSSGTVTLQFSSGFATYVISGNIQGQQFQGTVTYQIPAGNSMNTGQALQGTLGQINTNICYLLQCQNGF